jgi:thiol-disulfide isomerase/thioredoxin
VQRDYGTDGSRLTRENNVKMFEDHAYRISRSMPTTWIRYALLTAIASGLVALAPVRGNVAAAPTAKQLLLGDEGPMPELKGAKGWLNSAPLTTQSLRGKVVLVDVWTYSCINSLRQLPYLESWATKYKNQGLVVIGVHAPEFGFEKVPANVDTAVHDLSVTYPVAIDSDHKIWDAFHNQYWPADYFIDAKGRIRHHHFGEGDYEESERVIQELLKENGASGVTDSIARPTGTGIEAPPNTEFRWSPETYVGYGRAENFASPEHVAHDRATVYSLPATPGLDEWGLGGSWNVGAEHAVLAAAPGSIRFRFRGRDVHLVLGPSPNGTPVRFKVTVDGAAPGDDHGADDAADGSGEVREPRLYQLIRLREPAEGRTFEIEFLDPGVEAFVFTFG